VHVPFRPRSYQLDTAPRAVTETYAWPPRGRSCASDQRPHIVVSDCLSLFRCSVSEMQLICCCCHSTCCAQQLLKSHPAYYDFKEGSGTMCMAAPSSGYPILMSTPGLLLVAAHLVPTALHLAHAPRL
jgi:hypothetical protein